MYIAKTLLNDSRLKEKGRQKLAKLLGEKIDLNKFIVWFVENYPQSFSLMKAEPEIQYRVA